MEGVEGGREGWRERGIRPTEKIRGKGRKEREGWGYFVAGDEQD